MTEGRDRIRDRVETISMRKDGGQERRIRKSKQISYADLLPVLSGHQPGSSHVGQFRCQNRSQRCYVRLCECVTCDPGIGL